jgi:cytochrome c-type biogenesis protein CcmH/NrfG
MDEIESQIRKAIKQQGGATLHVLKRIESAIADNPESSHLWVLLGDAVQLSDTVEYRLEDAERCYQRAGELAPSSPTPQLELGYFYYAVMNDAAKAVPFFQRAVALGGGAEADEGLAEALTEAQSGEN